MSAKHQAPQRPQKSGNENSLADTRRGQIAAKFELLAISSLTPNPRNPRSHTRAQLRAIANSIEAFGFNAPILVDQVRNIVAGHGRYEAAKLLGWTKVPVVFLEHLSPTQAAAYMLADNKLTDRSSWNEVELARHLKELSELSLNFDIEAIGFEMPEIDLRIQSLTSDGDQEEADEFEFARGSAVSRLGDQWILGGHRIYCGSALDEQAYISLFGDAKATGVFTDPPFNVRIDGHVSGSGKVKHAEFPMASGEMSKLEFTSFLTGAFGLMGRFATPGAVVYACMDWRHLEEITTATRANELAMLNLCVWTKSNGGMGSFYRSMHELVFVFRTPGGQHLNNIQLGRFGRNRTNVWTYPGASGFPRNGRQRDIDFHPTVKPVAMVADAMLDSTQRGDIVLDPFLGSGTTILAATRVGRRGYGIELDPVYVDTAIDRWQRQTGEDARHVTGDTFSAVKLERATQS